LPFADETPHFLVVMFLEVKPKEKRDRQNILPEVTMKVGKIQVLQKIANGYKLKMFSGLRKRKAEFKNAAVINLWVESLLHCK